MIGYWVVVYVIFSFSNVKNNLIGCYGLRLIRYSYVVVKGVFLEWRMVVFKKFLFCNSLVVIIWESMLLIVDELLILIYFYD